MVAARWERLGKIFDPTEHALPNGCKEFAQSPQALVFDDFVRIYFATRQVDPGNGKYLSHIAYVDMDRGLRSVQAVSDHTVIPLGNLGCFDEHGIFPLNVVRHGDVILGYTCGWTRRVSVSVDTAVGLVISRDNGRTFQRVADGPVLASSLHEPCLVGDAFVRIIDGSFHMWYMFGTGWRQFRANEPPDRTYKIGHAVSDDGIHWMKEEARQIVPDRLGADESQALPTVIEIGGRYHMFFAIGNPSISGRPRAAATESGTLGRTTCATGRATTITRCWKQRMEPGTATCSVIRTYSNVMAVS